MDCTSSHIGVGEDFTPEAVAEIISQTRGYPYFLQEWGKHSWDVAERSPIALDNVVAASKEAIAALDESFFRVRMPEFGASWSYR